MKLRRRHVAHSLALLSAMTALYPALPAWADQTVFQRGVSPSSSYTNMSEPASRIYTYTTSSSPGNPSALYLNTPTGVREIAYFDVSGLPAGATITQATLRYYCYYPTTPIQGQVFIYRVRTNWLAGAAWTTAGGDWADANGIASGTAPYATFQATGTTGWFSWDVTTLAQGWLSGNFPNYGMFIMASSSAQGYAQFRGSGYSTLTLRPTLEVTYTLGSADTTPPMGSISINSGAANTNTTAVTLTLSASDASGVSEMQFSNDGTTYSAAEAYATSKNWTLSSGDGTKTVYVKFKDTAGNWMTTPATDTIVLDTTAPVSSGVSASNITQSGATVTWTTNEAATSQVEYGTTTSYGSLTPLDSTLLTSHSVALSGLGAGTLYHYRVRSKDAANNEAIGSDATFTTQALADTTAPTVNVTAPSAGATVSGTNVTVSANASDNVSVVGVQFKLDGANLGAEDTSSPYSIVWNTTIASNGSHSLTAVARDAAGNATTSTPVPVTVNNAVADATPPTATVTAPAGGALVRAGVIVTASASDNVGVVGVQFKLDGANLGAEDTVAPYGVTWDTTTATNGSHSLTAVARDAAGNAATSPAVPVTVDNASPVISSVTSAGITSSSAQTSWTTNETATSQVDYGTTASYGQSTTLDVSLVTSHSVSLSGLTASTLYHYRVRSKDAAGNEAISADFTFTTATAAGPLVFLESGGQVVMEAENADANISRNDKTWTLNTSSGGFSGTGYLIALPNNGQGTNAVASAAATSNPELQFQVYFSTTGTYYIWVRGYAASTADDNIHAGIDGTAPTSSDKMKLTATGTWNWTKSTNNTPATVIVSSAGIHTIHFWMYEDGFSIDKITLTTSSSFTPSGTGPAESPRGADTFPPTGTISINNGAAYTNSTSVTLSLSATDNFVTVSQMQFSNDNVTYSAPEAYAITKNWSLASGDGTKTVFVKFKDFAGNWSDPVSDTIGLDTTPPTTPSVTDDGAATPITSQLHAVWTASSDAATGVATYQYQIRRDSPTGAIIRDWTSVGTATSIIATNLSLTLGVTYYIGVQAIDGVGNISMAGFSDGILVTQITTVSSDITTNTTWTLAGSPYVVTRTVTIGSGVTLIIEPGVNVLFQDYFVNSVSLATYSGSGPAGTLVAQGTASRPITFTSIYGVKAPGQWGGLTLYNTPATVLDYCTIEYGGASLNSPLVQVYYSSPVIRNSTLQSSGGYGLYLYDASPVIDNVLVQNSVNHGIVLGGLLGSSPTITHTTIRNNSGCGIAPWQISSPTIIQNNITGNLAGGICSGAGVVARLNWWGDVSGPSGSGAGTGNAVSGNALFEPWLSQPFGGPFEWTAALNTPDPVTQAGGWTTFRGSLTGPANWVVTLKNAAGAIVRTFSGSGASFTQDWFGNDGAGTPLPDGTYTYQFSATSTGSGALAVPAVGQVTLNNAMPIAYITSPTVNQVIPANATLNVMGTAAGANFSSYKVEFGVGAAPTGWTLITSRTTSVTNGLLATWNTVGLTGPIYSVRVTATSTAGQSASMVVTVRLLGWTSPTDWPDPFSPNGNGVSETSALSATATFPVTWTLTIKNSANATVKTYSGSNGQMISQPWDGNDSAGVLVPDGVYTYQFQGTDPSSGVSTNSATGQVTVDRTPPSAVISSPTQNQILLTDDPLTVVGTASDANFSYYTLAYGAGSAPTSWSWLVTSYTPVTNGTLHTVNPQGWTVGTYTFRLTVVDRAGTPSVLNRSVTLDHIQVTGVSSAPVTIDPYAAEKSTIAYTISRPANISVQIYTDVSKQLVRALTQSFTSGGAKTTLWDGKNSSGAIVPFEAYYFTIVATDANGRRGTYNNATTPLQGPAPTYTISVDTTNFNAYRNDRLPISYNLSVPGRITLEVRDGWSWNLIRMLHNGVPRAAGVHTDYWDGRHEDGSVYEGPYTIVQPSDLSLPRNPIVVARAPIEFANFRAEAYLIQPVYREVSLLTYSLTRSATVSITLMDPNGNMIRTLRSNVSQAAGNQSVEWDGRTEGGSVVAVEGDYTVTMTAVDPVSGMSYQSLGTVVVYK